MSTGQKIIVRLNVKDEVENGSLEVEYGYAVEIYL